MDLTVLALRGLTSTTKVWDGLAAALPQARIVAPDLAGRTSAAERRTAERADANHLTLLFDPSVPKAIV